MLPLQHDPALVLVKAEMQDVEVASSQLAVPSVDTDDHQSFPVDGDAAGVNGEAGGVICLDGDLVAPRIERSGRPSASRSASHTLREQPAARVWFIGAHVYWSRMRSRPCEGNRLWRAAVRVMRCRGFRRLMACGKRDERRAHNRQPPTPRQRLHVQTPMRPVPLQRSHQRIDPLHWRRVTTTTIPPVSNVAKLAAMSYRPRLPEPRASARAMVRGATMLRAFVTPRRLKPAARERWDSCTTYAAQY